jgi:uncharacterized BrkB/YihY/UPF0761 family membrane protein
LTDAHDIVVLPLTPKLLDYPATIGIGVGIVFITVLLIISSKFDHTGGVLTISLLIVLAFIGVVTFCMFFTIPNDEITSGVIGGLVAAFGAVIAHWIGRDSSSNGNGPPAGGKDKGPQE